MDTQILFIFAVSIALLYIKPGPNQAMKITKALHDGFMSAWFFTLGATSTVVFYFIIAGLGTEIIQSFIGATGIYFKVIGGCYLLYMGYKGLLNIDKGVWREQPEQHSATKNLMGSYGLGVVMTLANPITIFYFIGIMPTFMTLGVLDLSDIAMGVGLIILVGNITDILLISLVTQAKQTLSETKFVRRINIFASMGFVVIGAFLLFSAIIAFGGVSKL